MSNRYANFIPANKSFWSKIPVTSGSNGLLLVEPNRHPLISHANAVTARIIKEARGLNIAWLDTGDPEIQERMVSYDSTSRTVTPKALTRIEKLRVGWKFMCSALKILLTGKILGFSLDGIVFGDILYDSYLALYKVATIAKVNKGVLKTLWILIKNYYRTKTTLQSCRASAILVSDQIGMSSGVLLRTALKLGLRVYLRTAGNSKIALNIFNSLSEIYQYPYKPRSIDMELLTSIDLAKLDEEFQDLMAERIESLFDKDAARAYDKSKKEYHSKDEFADEFGISPGRPFIFVMLHAFNDHPHSHFGEMLFKDYYDWFVQTLEFAGKKTNVNWIFKEHPTAALHPTRDISLKDHFRKCPDHITFLDRDSSFNSKSLLHICDAVITVAGTCGIEFAAAAAIPSLLVGPTFYSGFGFTLEPKTKAEYFEILGDIEHLNRLNESQQNTARRVFLYTLRYSYVPFPWSPFCTLPETKDPNFDSYYWPRVTDIYARESERLFTEFEKYASFIRNAEFSRLARLQLLD